MATGKLKIKNNRKVELKVNGKDMSVPKEYDFSDIEIGHHECEVNLDNGRIVEIIVNDKAIPKKDLEVQRKAQEAQKREQEAIAQKEREKQEREKQRVQPVSQNNQNQEPMDSFKQDLAKLPNDLPSIGREDLKTSNFALKLYKFARFDAQDKNKAKFFAGTKSGNYFIKHNDYGLGQKINEIAVKHKESAKILFNTEGCLEVKNFKPDWRVIVGLGTDSVYETGITLHHIYGFPYIPASAIKGITRSYVIGEKFQNSEDLAFQNKEFCDIFGCTSKSYDKTARKGKITFFDAMPLTPPELKPDIMNVHYPKYYGEGQAPTDTQNPVPILFLTVEKTEFQFMLGCKEENKDLLKTAIDWLKNALEQKGIGAKTAVGYGYMKEP